MIRNELVPFRICLPSDNPPEAIVLGYIKQGLGIYKPYRHDGTQETGIKRWIIVHLGTGTSIGTIKAYKRRAETIRDFILEGIDWESWGVFGVNEDIPQECVARYIEVREVFKGEFAG